MPRRALSPPDSRLLDVPIRIHPLCCNFLYPKQFLGLIGWMQLSIGLFFFYTVSDVDILKKANIPGFDSLPFSENQKRMNYEEYHSKMLREIMELNKKRMLFFVLGWSFFIGGCMTFLSFNWPHPNSCVKNYTVSRIIPLLMLVPTLFNMTICLYPLISFCIKTSSKFLLGDCKSLATLQCTNDEFTFGYVMFVLAFCCLLLALYSYLYWILFCACRYIWNRTYRGPLIHKAVKVSTSWCHAAAKTRPHYRSTENDTASSSEANEYAGPPTSFATVKQVYNLHEINEMNNEYAPLPMRTFKSTNTMTPEDSLPSFYGPTLLKSSYLTSSQCKNVFTSPWDRYGTLEFPSLHANGPSSSAMI